jgi:hypothetical protein
MSEGKVVEYDMDGKVVWSVAAKSAWQAIRLNLKTAVDLVPERRNGYHCST